MAESGRVRSLGKIDVRFIIGVTLVVASVAGVVSVMTAWNRTEPVYVVTEPLASGELVTIDMLRVEQVNLGASGESYVRPGDDLASKFSGRALEPGEMLPKSALVGAAASESITTVIPVTGALPVALRAGSRVDVWAAPDGSVRLDKAVAPAAVLTDVEIVRISTDSGFASANSSDVELRIPRNKLQGVLLAQGLGMSFTVVAIGTGA